MKKLIVLILTIIILPGGFVKSGFYRVSNDGNDNNDGLSWKNAFATIQKALDVSVIGDVIFVAEGKYHPTYDYKLNIGERGKHFELKDGVNLLGGFPKTGNPIPQERNHLLYPTIICGDLNKDDKWNEDKKMWENRDDNCYHLFYNSTLKGIPGVLDGFVIQNGNANSLDTLYNRGGGMYSLGNALWIYNCTFKNNYAEVGGGLYFDVSWVTMRNCFVLNNTSNFGGGGIYSGMTGLELINCVVAENTSLKHTGGGIYQFLSMNKNSKIINCTITKNSSYNQGGGIINITQTMYDGEDICNSFILNSIIYDNKSLTSDMNNDIQTVYVQIGPGYGYGKTILDYCLVGNNVDAVYNMSLEIKYCLKYADPDFLGKGDNPYMLTKNSRCLDMGNNDYIKEEYDIRGFPRKVNKKDSTLEKIVDIGAYEYNYPIDVVSVNDNDYLSTISIYPNPASDYIEISIPDNANHTMKSMVENGVQIFNTLGIEVGQSTLIVNSSDTNGQAGMLNLLRIDISNLPTGVYFIKIGDKVEKFVKM
jgi:hypothetical protein